MSTALSGLVAPGDRPHANRMRRRVDFALVYSALAAVCAIPSRLVAYWAERRRLARTVDQLQGLSDRMLADIGLAGTVFAGSRPWPAPPRCLSRCRRQTRHAYRRSRTSGADRHGTGASSPGFS